MGEVFSWRRDDQIHIDTWAVANGLVRLSSVTRNMIGKLVKVRPRRNMQMYFGYRSEDICGTYQCSPNSHLSRKGGHNDPFCGHNEPVFAALHLFPVGS